MNIQPLQLQEMTDEQVNYLVAQWLEDNEEQSRRMKRSEPIITGRTYKTSERFSSLTEFMQRTKR